MTDTILRDVKLVRPGVDDVPTVDIAITDGRVTEVGPDLTVEPGVTVHQPSVAKSAPAEAPKTSVRPATAGVDSTHENQYEKRQVRVVSRTSQAWIM